jgi:hypothetical protein
MWLFKKRLQLFAVVVSAFYFCFSLDSFVVSRRKLFPPVEFSDFKGGDVLNKFKSFSGFCSHLNGMHSITVECADMNSKTTSGWKPIRFECAHEARCSDVKKCSVVASLPDVFPA